MHQSSVKALIGSLHPLSRFAFAAACMERSWPVYERASRGKPWAAEMLLRGALEAVWEWLCGDRARPLLAKECEQAIPEAGSTYDDTLGFYAANDLYGLLDLVERDDSAFAWSLAQANLDRIDAFVYDLLDREVTSENDLVVDRHELMVAEMRFQMECCSKLGPAPPARSTVKDVRELAEATSVFGRYWHDD